MTIDGERHPIAALDLPPRTRHALQRGGIQTLEDAAQWSERDLLSLPQFGRAGNAALRALLAKLGREMNP
jgi:DNA-directed RNA polymerase alpha subunit